jgi:hypothetical protein
VAAEVLARRQIPELQTLREAGGNLCGKPVFCGGGRSNLLVGLDSNMKPAQVVAVLGKMDPPKAVVKGGSRQELEQRHAPFRR